MKGRSRWKVQDIAGPIYILGKFVTERLNTRTGRGKPNSKMEALSVMYLFYMQEIALEDERRRSATEATRKAAKSSKATNPLPPDFVFNPKKVRLLSWHCISMGSFTHRVMFVNYSPVCPGCGFSLPSLPMYGHCRQIGRSEGDQKTTE